MCLTNGAREETTQGTAGWGLRAASNRAGVEKGGEGRCGGREGVLLKRRRVGFRAGGREVWGRVSGLETEGSREVTEGRGRTWIREEGLGACGAGGGGKGDLDPDAPGWQDVGLGAGPPRGQWGWWWDRVGAAGKVEPRSSGLGEEKPRLTA